MLMSKIASGHTLSLIYCVHGIWLVVELHIIQHFVLAGSILSHKVAKEHKAKFKRDECFLNQYIWAKDLVCFVLVQHVLNTWH